jgi:hypothetical protein
MTAGDLRPGGLVVVEFQPGRVALAVPEVVLAVQRMLILVQGIAAVPN